MGLIDTEAVILRTYNLAEADKIVISFTRCCGLTRGVANGARRLKSRFGAALEPFTVVKLSYFEKEGRELGSIKQAEIQRSYFDLTRAADTVACMAYMAGLLMEFAPPHEPNEHLFRLVQTSLETLAHSPNKGTAIKRYFEIWILKLSGLMPEMRACAVCRKHFETQEKSYMNEENGVHCEACSHARGEVLGANTRLMLRALLSISPAKFAQQWPDFGEESRDEARRLSGRLIERALERRPRVSE